MTANVDTVLAEHGLGEYSATLKANGLATLADLRGVTDADLKAIGIDKLFHRKRILQIAEDEDAKARGALAGKGGSANGGSAGSDRGGTGDHIRVEVLGARGAETALSEREHYVKVCLCDKIEHDIYPIESTVHKTARARGPQPVWTANESTAIKVKTSFRSHSLALELKEHRMFGENKLIGVLIFPMTKFHAFTAGYVEETWHMLRAESDDTSEVTGSIMLRLSVPGGCPKAVGPAYHVTSVVMNQRKLRVTVFDAALVHDSASEPTSPKKGDSLPSMYVSLHLEGAAKQAAVDEAHIKEKTAVVAHSANPVFDQAFTFYAEAGRCKLLTVKLKRDTGGLFASHQLVGTVRIPIQYFLAQRHASEVDEVFPALDESNTVRAKIHIRLQVLPKDAPDEPVRGRFKRSSSVADGEPDAVDVDDHPAFSPKKKGSGPNDAAFSDAADDGDDGGSSAASGVDARRGRLFDGMTAGGGAAARDDDDDAHDMAAAAARRNQRAASGQFGRHDDDLI